MNRDQTEGKWKQFWETVHGLRNAGVKPARTESGRADSGERAESQAGKLKRT